MMIKGMPVTLYEKVQTGTDDFGAPTYEETPVIVENVLVGQPSSTEIIDEINISGKKLVYTLGIPKGDDHSWEDSVVEFFGRKYKTFGLPLEGIPELIPLQWHKQIKVEVYE